jgi:hypothetical protein
LHLTEYELQTRHLSVAPCTPGSLYLLLIDAYPFTHTHTHTHTNTKINLRFKQPTKPHVAAFLTLWPKTMPRARLHSSSVFNLISE